MTMSRRDLYSAILTQSFAPDAFDTSELKSNESFIRPSYLGDGQHVEMEQKKLSSFSLFATIGTLALHHLAYLNTST